jgi:hypothetical protein
MSSLILLELKSFISPILPSVRLAKGGVKVEQSKEKENLIFVESWEKQNWIENKSRKILYHIFI